MLQTVPSAAAILHDLPHITSLPSLSCPYVNCMHKHTVTHTPGESMCECCCCWHQCFAFNRSSSLTSVWLQALCCQFHPSSVSIQSTQSQLKRHLIDRPKLLASSAGLSCRTKVPECLEIVVVVWDCWRNHRASSSVWLKVKRLDKVSSTFDCYCVNGSLYDWLCSVVIFDKFAK